MTINIIMVTALPMPPKRKNLMGRENLFSGEKATNANTVMSAKNGAKKSATRSTACWPFICCPLTGGTIPSRCGNFHLLTLRGRQGSGLLILNYFQNKYRIRVQGQTSTTQVTEKKA